MRHQFDAVCSWNSEASSVEIIYNKDEPRVDGFDLMSLARHEMIHALLEPFNYFAHNRIVTQKQLDDANHEVLRRLNPLLPK